MARLIIATHNRGKAEEFKALLAPYYEVIHDLHDIGLTQPIAETKDSFYGNALLKATHVYNLTTDGDVLADDSGLCVDALCGEPSVFSARYAGEHATDKDNRAKLLAKMIGIAERKAHFETCLVMLRRDGKQVTSFGQTEGEILFKEHGSNGFGYDSLFYSYDLHKSFAESTPKEKNSVSHRSRAIAALLRQLTQE